MFDAIGSLLTNTVRAAVAVVSVPARIVDNVVVKPVAYIAESISDELK